MTLGVPGEGLLIFGASSIDKTSGGGHKGELGITAGRCNVILSRVKAEETQGSRRR